MGAAAPEPDGTPSRHSSRPTTSHGLQPLRQGTFDGLSGLYAIINGVRLLLAPERPLKPREAKRLFDRGVAVLSRRRDLVAAVLAGVDRGDWPGLLAAMLAEAGRITGRELDAEQPFECEPPTPAAVLALIEDAIAARRPVLVEVERPGHWSVIAPSSATRLRLFNSDGAAWLSRGDWLGGVSTHRANLIIDPAALTVLRLA